MHNWGDEFLYFEEVGEAAEYIGRFLRKWARVSVTNTKEKYGTVRVYCSFGWSQFFSITHPGYAYSRYPKWLWNLDVSYGSKLIHLLRINNIIIPLQTMLYRYVYKQAIKKWPMIREEILNGADWDEYLGGL